MVEVVRVDLFCGSSLYGAVEGRGGEGRDFRHPFVVRLCVARLGVEVVTIGVVFLFVVRPLVAWLRVEVVILFLVRP